MARNKFDVDESLEEPFNLSHLKRALQYAAKYKWKMLLALFLNAVCCVIGQFGPKLYQWALDEAVPSKNYDLLIWLALGYLGIAVISILIVTVQARIMAFVSNDIICDIRRDLFAHLQKLPFSYYDSRPGGKILVRVVNYVNSVSDILTNGIINMIVQIVSLVFIIVFMFATSVRLSLVILAGLPLFVFFVIMIKPAQRRSWQQMSNKSSNYNAYLAESIQGVRVSQLFARQDENQKIMDRLSANFRTAWIRALYITHTVWLSSGIITDFVCYAVYIFGAVWVGGGVSVGVVVAMISYCSSFWTPITSLANIYNSFINNIAYLERIFQTMDEPVDIADAPDARVLPPITGEIDFSHVVFGYEPGIHILEDFNLHVLPGQSIALVGETGAGKTTIVNLISRFYDIEDGKISVYAKNGNGSTPYSVKDVTIRSLRSQLGIMMQDSFIFSGTVMENIRYGKPDATEDEVIAAAKAVCAHNFISEMPMGYQTEVSERGGNLSQGQRQMISFARTLLSDPSILILDEATSSIDTKTERMLQQGIATLLKNRTSFIIAHRLSTIKNCDQILVIGNKGIIEQGTHDELIVKKGAYFRLSSAQQ